MRRTVHSTFGVSCVLDTGSGTFPLSARFHDKIAIGGDIEPTIGYANTIEGVTHVVFNREELTALSVVPDRNMLLTFTDYLATGQDMVVRLDTRIPYDGPIDEKWSVGVQ